MKPSTMSMTFNFRPDTKAAIGIAPNGSIVWRFQNAEHERLIAVPDAFAKPYVSLVRHRTDLGRVRAFLGEIDRQGGIPPPSRIKPGWTMPVAVQALWLSALSATMKCFSDSRSREQLNPAKVFGIDKSDPVRASFDLLKALRNKHVMHDENDWMLTVPYAIVGTAEDDKPSVTEIDCIMMEGTDTAHIGQLKAVVEAAGEWVEEAINSLAGEIRTDLLGRAYSEVAAMKRPPDVKLPNTGSIVPKPR